MAVPPWRVPGLAGDARGAAVSHVKRAIATLVVVVIAAVAPAPASAAVSGSSGGVSPGSSSPWANFTY